MSLDGPSRTSGDVRLKSAKRAQADIDQAAATTRDLMSARPNTTLADLLTLLFRADPSSAVRTAPRA